MHVITANSRVNILTFHTSKLFYIFSSTVKENKWSIYSNKVIHIRGAIQKFVDKLNICFIYYQI